jgi:hypothetical protein
MGFSHALTELQKAVNKHQSNRVICLSLLMGIQLPCIALPDSFLHLLKN